MNEKAPEKTPTFPIMAEEKTRLQERIESGRPILLAEISPPTGGDPGPLGEVARRFAGKVHALGISDNRQQVCMSALAAASLAAAEGVEPILHVVTRDRNRIALVSDYLGARALGIRNLLCTTGTHQTLGRFRTARNVFDVDSIQLLQTYAGLAGDGSIVGEERIDLSGPACLGAVAAPFADPLELQIVRLAKKIAAGARFLITQPVFDLERFAAWWKEVTRRGIHKRVAIIAGVQVLPSAQQAEALAAGQPRPMIPRAVLERLASKTGADAQREEGLNIARQTIEQLSGLEHLRGFQICAEDDAGSALQLIDHAGLKID